MTSIFHFLKISCTSTVMLDRAFLSIFCHLDFTLNLILMPTTSVLPILDQRLHFYVISIVYPYFCCISISYQVLASFVRAFGHWWKKNVIMNITDLTIYDYWQGLNIVWVSHYLYVKTYFFGSYFARLEIVQYCYYVIKKNIYFL